jgi:nitroreductase
MMEPAGIAPNAVDTAITSRRSLRAFRPDPVPRALVEHLLDVAARAPSGTNMQPWRVHVLTGAAKDRLGAAVLSAFETDAPQPPHEYRYYPEKFFEPFQSRRRKVGFDMYALLGIARGDTAAMKRQHGRNFVFFDAPVALIFTIDRRLEHHGRRPRPRPGYLPAGRLPILSRGDPPAPRAGAGGAGDLRHGPGRG